MFRFRKTLILILAFLSILTVGSFALAQADLGLNSAANIGLQDGGGDVRDLIIRIVQYLLTFVGIIATAVVLYGGFLWMTAGGRADQIRKAKQTLMSGIIGVIIILSAFAIVTFIMNLTQDSLAPTCTATCSPGDKCCNGSPDYCIANADICCASDGAGFCSAGQYCCASGCSATPCIGDGPGLSFSIIDTIPDNGQSGVIKNVRLIFNFNMNIDSSTVDATTFQVLDGGVPISGSINVNGNRIIFQPDAGTCPANACGADQCFADNITVNVLVHSIQSTSGDSLEYIYPLAGPPINCGSGALPACDITFDVGDTIDCDDPFVGLDFVQICAGPGNNVTVNASDGSGLADIGLSIDDGGTNYFLNTALAGDALTFSNIFGPFDGTSYPASVTVTASANDIDSHSSSHSVVATVRPGHCCNGLLDLIQGEEGVDCGGPCAECDGAACGVSLNDDCDDLNLDCHARDDICSSRYCDCTAAAGSECQDAGYVTGVDDCCLCQQQPIIDWITPMGGFCRDGTTFTNTACLSDQYCIDNEATAHTCDIDTVNADNGNLITIYGRNFGEADGDVNINGINAPLANEAGIGCTDDYWSNTKIVVQVPAFAVVDFTTVDVEVIEAETGNAYSDFNNDNPGEEPVFDFVINTIARPGLCDISPVNGPPETTVIAYSGIQIGTANAYFGNLSNPIEAFNSALNDGQATVPQLNPGEVSTFAISGQTYSNYQNFTVDAVTPPGPEIISFDPINGALGTYVTIYGHGFGNTQSTSIVNFGAIEADYNFPAICDGGTWSDSQVIIKVPTTVAAGAQNIQMVLASGYIIDTSALTPAQFNVNTTLRPSLCSLVPLAQDLGQEVTLAGEYFGVEATALVRFHSGQDNNIFNDFSSGAGDHDYALIDIPLIALTGPVRMVQSGIEGNSMNLTIGTCLDAPVPDDACAGVSVCCANGTFREGQCQADTDACNLKAGAAVYEWDFSTRAGDGELGDSCSDGICGGSYPPCSGALICDTVNTCTCQLPCGDISSGGCTDANDLVCKSLGTEYVCDTTTCFCVEDIPGDSCQGKAERTGECAPEVCPNSAGYCSPNDNTDVDQGACVFDCGGGIGYENINDRCEINIATIDCIGEVIDLSGSEIKTNCRLDPGGDGNYYWQYSTSASCPTNWTKMSGDVCVHNVLAEECSAFLCPSDFTCNTNNENCVADDEICPGRAECTASDRCILENNDICECCCEVGESARDCCYPLDCVAGCGLGWIDTNNDNIQDAGEPGAGYCSGCADASNPDLACNCVGHSDKFCDIADIDFPDGICRDCGALSTGECISESGCCLDAMNGDICRGTIVDSSGNAEKMASGSCAYYECDSIDPTNVLCDSATQLVSGDYDVVDTCNAECPFTGGLSPGSDCYNIAENDCNLLCAGTAFNCMGIPAVPPGDDCLCCCDTTVVDTCPGELNCQEASPCENNNRGLCCGCTDDASCGTPTLTGCGTDECCHGRPSVNVIEPVDDASDVCRNTAITATFNEIMGPGSIINSFYVVGQYVTACPDNTQYLVYNNENKVKDKNFLVNIKNRIILSLGKAWNNIWGPDSAVAYVAPQSMYNYCAVPGTVNSEIILDETKITFSPQILLDPDRLYYAIIKGDKDFDSKSGVLSKYGIGMNASGNSPSYTLLNGASDYTFNGIEYTNSYIWSFTTLSDQKQEGGVCLVDRVRVTPRSYLFQTVIDDVDELDSDPNDESFDAKKDSDKLYSVRAYSDENQILSPIPGIYDWDWDWDIANTNVVYFSTEAPAIDLPDDGSRRLVEATATAVDGNTTVSAKINMLSGITDGNGKIDSVPVFVFICQNPWPPIANDGTWSPWIDGNNCTFDTPEDICDNTNFSMYYCRDAGGSGTFDDLPIIGSAAGAEQVIRERDGDILKEVFFPRGAIPADSTTITAINAGVGAIAEISWGQIVGINSYRLYWGTRSGDYDNFATIQNSGAYASNNEQVACGLVAGDIVCTVDELENDTNYYFTLSSVSTNGAESEFYNEEVIFIEDTIGFSAPTNLIAAGMDSQVELEWDEVVGASGYKIYFKAGSGCNNIIDFPPDCYASSIDIDTDTSVIVSGLTNGNTYYFAVTAYDEFGNEDAYSNEVNAVPSF